MHNIEEYEMSEYQKYINLVAQKKTDFYLSKNNNNILRLNSYKNLKIFLLS